MNVSAYISLLVILSLMSLLVIAMIQFLELLRVTTKQKLIFLKSFLIVICISPIVDIGLQLTTAHTNLVGLLNHTMIVTVLSYQSMNFAHQQLQWPMYIISLYGCSFLFMLGRIAWSYYSSMKQFKNAKPVVIQGKVVFTGEHIQSPMCFGLPKSRIYFPTQITNRWTDREVEICLSHEQNHLDHYDIHWKLLSLFANAILFFVPWSYYLHYKFELECEIYCDEKTRELTRSSIREYGNLLLTMINGEQRQMTTTQLTNSNLKRG